MQCLGTISHVASRTYFKILSTNNEQWEITYSVFLIG